MRYNQPAAEHPTASAVHVQIGSIPECLETLAALIGRRASEINQRHAGMPDDGMDVWQLAENQIEQPLCCGVLKQDEGCLITLDSSGIGTREIKVCVEPRRVILLGWSGITDRQPEPVVRVLRLPDEVLPSSMAIRQQGPILEIKLQRKGTSRMAMAA